MDLNTNSILGSDDMTNSDALVAPEPSEQQLNHVRYLAGIGIRPVAIGEQLSVTTDYLLNRCEHEMKDALENEKEAVMQNLYYLATCQTNLAASVLWLKNHAPDLLPAIGKNGSQKSPKNKPYVWNPNDPNDRVRFRVYNNDGEPNADY